MINIAIIINALNNGGAERIAGLLSKYLNIDNNVYLFITDPTNIVYDYDGDIVDVGKDGERYFEYNIREAKKRYRIDVSISFMESLNFINIRTKGDEAVIISQRNMRPLREEKEYYQRWMRKSLYPQAEYMVAISKGVEKKLIEDGLVLPDRTITIYNFFECNQIIKKSSEKSEEFSEEFFRKYHIIISVGRLVEQKNHRRLLKQFTFIYERDSLARLIIIGSGHLLEYLQRYCEELGLIGKVFFLPYCCNPFSLVKKAHVFVLSSRWEGFGNVLLEAMALKVPIVSVDCESGPREIIEGMWDYSSEVETWSVCKRGILVTNNVSEDSGHTHFMADAIIYAMKRRKKVLNMIDVAYKYVLSWSNDIILKQWELAISEAMNVVWEQHYDLGENVEKKKHRSKRYIYGAGQFAHKLIQQCRKDRIKIDGFIVSEKNDKIYSFEGLPVFDIKGMCTEKNKAIVYVGVEKAVYRNEVVNLLQEYGFIIEQNPVLEKM